MKKSELQENIDYLLCKVCNLMGEDAEKKEPEAAPEERETLHVFRVEGGLLILRDEAVNKPPIVESLFVQTPPTPASKPEDLRFYVLWAIAFLLLAYIILGSLLSSYLLPTATITIIPNQHTISERQVISIVAKAPVAGQIEGHLFTQTLSQTMRVSASGKGHQNAAYSEGAITFYNGLLTAQRISPGTILTGADGIQVVTSQEALIPPASPPVEGEASVAAHAVKIGAIGNIAAKDINVGCCGQGILAINRYAFQGGADARDFIFVSATDIKNASFALTKNITQAFTQGLVAQTRSNESAIPPACDFREQSNHLAGDEAPSVSVTITGTCISVLYSDYALQNEAERLLAANAKRFGAAYTSLDYQQVQVVSQTLRGRGNIIGAVTTEITGTWGYQFPKGEAAQIKALVAGKSRVQALKLLQATEGVQRAAITGVGQTDSLPRDRAHIAVVFLYFVH